MKTLIIGAGPLGSLYTYLFTKAGYDCTLLARNDHYIFLNEIGLNLVNEFTNQRINQKISVVNTLSKDDHYDLVIVMMRKNSVKSILPMLSSNKHIKHILFMGNNAIGFSQYLSNLPKEKILFGFPGGAGARMNHVVHYIDSEKPNEQRLPVIIGEMNGKIKDRTRNIIKLFESIEIPTKYVDDIDGWLKYHAAFIVPLAGALLMAGNNYRLSQKTELIKEYIRSIRECSQVLRSLGYSKSYNPKFNLIKMMPEGLTVKILQKVFDSKFAEVAMMMHVNAAGDEMAELGSELISLRDKTNIQTPNLDTLIDYIKLSRN